MRLKHKLLIKLSRKTGINKTELCDLVATRKRPSYKRATYLETVTNIHHDLWLGGSAEEIKTKLNELEIL